MIFLLAILIFLTFMYNKKLRRSIAVCIFNYFVELTRKSDVFIIKDKKTVTIEYSYQGKNYIHVLDFDNMNKFDKYLAVKGNKRVYLNVYPGTFLDLENCPQRYDKILIEDENGVTEILCT